MLYESICLVREDSIFHGILTLYLCDPFSKDYLNDPQALSKRYIRHAHGSPELRIPFTRMYPHELSKGSK
jgi:hypothetical protein